MTNTSPDPPSLRSLVGQLSSDTMLFGLGTVLPSALTFLLVPLYTRNLAPAELGLLNLVQTIIAILLIMATAGLDSGVALVVAEDRPQRANIISAAILSLLGSATIVAALALGCGYLINPVDLFGVTSAQWNRAILLGAILVPIRSCAGFCMALMKWRRRSSRFAVLAIATNLIVLGVVGFFLLSPGADAVTILSAFIIAYGLSSAIILWTTIRTECAAPAQWSALPGVFAIGIPFLISGTFELLLPVINRSIIANHLGIAAVGILAAGWSLSYVVTVCTTAFSLAYQPLALFAAARSNDHDTIPTIARWYTVALFIVVITVATLARPLVHLILGGGVYRDAFLVLPAFLCAVWLAGVRVTYEMGLVAARRTGLFIRAYAQSCILGAAAAWLGCRYAGIVGAAWSVALAELVLAVTLFRSVQRVRPLAFVSGVTPRLLLTYLLVAAALLIEDSNLIRALAWCLAVCSALVWSGGVTASERSWLMSMILPGRDRLKKHPRS